MDLEYKKTHTCPNDCVLYRDKFITLKVCPTCGLSWFKKKFYGISIDEKTNGPPTKV